MRELSASSLIAIVALLASSVLASSLLTGCDDTPPVMTDAGTDAGPPDPVDAGVDAGSEPDAGPACEGPPGLYVDGSCDVLAPGVRAYVPRFELWADDADKERYVLLPAGTQIDTSDPDNWVYPVGTTLFKTFLIAGVRLETRILEKTDPGAGLGAWDQRVFAWNEAQDAVTEVTNLAEPERQNVLGTDHDIPSGADCLRCHGGRDVVNGFTAIQLEHDLGGVTLQTLRDEARLTDPIAAASTVVPGDATAIAALGYLHANCGHCHREVSSDAAAMSTGLWMWLELDTATVDATNTYATAVGTRASFFDPTAYCRIYPGDPAASLIVRRMNTRGSSAQMPPLASEIVEAAGVDAVSAWITAVTGDATACAP